MILPVALAFVLAGAVHGAVPPEIPAARFSAMTPGAPPPEWMPYAFSRHPRHTEYRLVSDAGITVLRAEADASVSALLRKVSFETAAYPLMRWRWKVDNVLEKADLRTRQGDDFPARIYVLFDYDAEKLSLADRAKIGITRLVYGAEVPAAALCYVWASRAPAGTIAPNAYTDRVRMVVVRSGSRDLGRWVMEERDLVRDFRAAFGEEPPPVKGVAVASDTDNTGEHAVAWFGDIAFHRPGPRN
jgi:hypothetical protein